MANPYFDVFTKPKWFGMVKHANCRYVSYDERRENSTFHVDLDPHEVTAVFYFRFMRLMKVKNLADVLTFRKEL